MAKSRFDYDLFVIGAGSGGVRAARMAAGHGARVAVAEDKPLGGTCVNVGCVPKKLLAHAARFPHDFAQARGYGWTVDAPRFDWPTLIASKNAEIARLNGVYERLLDGAGVRLARGRARVLDPHTVAVDGARFTAERILVAVGGRPFVPDLPGAEHVITSDDAFFLDRLPPRALVVGGGYIAVEFAGIFNGLGASVTQAYRGDLFLRGFDGDLRCHLADGMAAAGVDLRFGASVTAVSRRPDGALAATLADGGTIEADVILYATGRRPNTAGLGLEEVGVALAPNGAVRVDDGFRSSVPSIYAIGDVIDRTPLTPVAIEEAMVLTDTLFGGRPRRMDYADIATAVFSQPALATVGLSEEDARARHGADDVAVYRAVFRPLKNTLGGSGERTLVKLVVHRATDRVLGAHMAGPEAAEIIQGLAVAVKAGVTKAQMDATMAIHPTTAEEFVTLRAPV